MRKPGSRPNQSARKQMPGYTVELFPVIEPEAHAVNNISNSTEQTERSILITHFKPPVVEVKCEEKKKEDETATTQKSEEKQEGVDENITVIKENSETKNDQHTDQHKDELEAEPHDQCLSDSEVDPDVDGEIEPIVAENNENKSDFFEPEVFEKFNMQVKISPSQQSLSFSEVAPQNSLFSQKQSPSNTLSSMRQDEPSREPPTFASLVKRNDIPWTRAEPPPTNGGFGGNGFLTAMKDTTVQRENPFANRKRLPIDGMSKQSRFEVRNDDESKFASHNRQQQNNDTVTLPAWWKTRSFSSASCYYPQNMKSQYQQKELTMVNVPAAGSLEDIDGYLTTTHSHPVYKKNDLSAKKERWARVKAKKRILRRPVEDDYFEEPDLEEEIMCGRGVLVNQIVNQNQTGQYEDTNLIQKYRRDVNYIKEIIMKHTHGSIEGIRDLRFLVASVQTFGNIDGQCMMAEIAVNEFTLLSGIIERYHAIVGSWSTLTENQKRRATRHAFDTHKIPLQHNFATTSKKKLVEEILGRTEPSIASRQGVKVGLYSDTCDEKNRINLNLKNSFKDPGMIVDTNERRFILVLQSEFELMLESMKNLAKTVGLPYDGFPTTSDRYIIVEAFVDAIAELIGETVPPETMQWFGVLGQKVQVDSVSPWEKNMDLHCTRHAEPKSNFCAEVTVCRVCCIIYHVLGSFFRKYHLKKIPTNFSS